MLIFINIFFKVCILCKGYDLLKIGVNNEVLIGIIIYNNMIRV